MQADILDLPIELLEAMRDTFRGIDGEDCGLKMDTPCVVKEVWGCLWGRFVGADD